MKILYFIRSQFGHLECHFNRLCVWIFFFFLFFLCFFSPFFRMLAVIPVSDFSFFIFSAFLVHSTLFLPKFCSHQKWAFPWINDKLCFAFIRTEDVTLVEFMCFIFTRMLGESYRRRLRSLLLYLCYVFRALVNSLVCWSLRRTLRLNELQKKNWTTRAHYFYALCVEEMSLLTAWRCNITLYACLARYSTLYALITPWSKRSLWICSYAFSQVREPLPC